MAESSRDHFLEVFIKARLVEGLSSMQEALDSISSTVCHDGVDLGKQKQED